MAGAVAHVRGQADDVGSDHRAGTALALTRETMTTSNLEADLDFVPMAEDGSLGSAARVLEIFLDRLAWSAARSRPLAAEYLLDRRYASALSDADRALQRALNGLDESMSDAARSSSGWPMVEELLRRLGK